MSNNKVSEKAIWEGAITPDNNTPSMGSQIQAQPQMMFCYKCNNVIPSNSKFCPCCNVLLFTTCPKCGVKYSSQYLICNQCGTNREEYLLAQRREQERKEAIERENRRRQEILEKEKREREQQEALKRCQQREAERKQKEAYLRENAEIMKTAEYISVYSAVNEIFGNAFEMHNKKCKLCQNLLFLFVVLPFIPIIILFFIQGLHTELIVASGILFIPLILLIYPYNKVYYDRTIYLIQCYIQYISDKKDYDKGLLTQDLVKKVKYQGLDKLSECCIIAYRKKHGLPINEEWHSL